jgi:CheY-like chemotaxis protein
MRKRVLVAEAADAVRQVVESILRQNGYDVIAVSAAEKAFEVLQFSRPDLVVAGGDLKDSAQRLFYDVVQSDPKTNSLPLLVIEPADKSAVSLPPEVVITRPVEPKDFMQRIGIFLGQAVTPGKTPPPNPVPSGTVDDSFLDAALGLDRIDVTASEDMDRTSTNLLRRAKPAAPKVTAYDGGEEEAMNESRKVESLHIRDDVSEIKAQNTKAPQKGESSGTGKIEIVRDQYGMTDPNAFQLKPERQEHDYDWFVNAMRDEVAAVETKGPGSPATPSPASPSKSGDSQKLRVTETASIIDPLTPAGPAPAGHPATGTGAAYSEGVEKFIDEFKKEIELLRSREPEPPAAPIPSVPLQPAAKVNWEEEVEALTVDNVRLFSRELTARLAEKLAERITAKIDPDKLLQLIKDELIAAARQKSADSH